MIFFSGVVDDFLFPVLSKSNQLKFTKLNIRLYTFYLVSHTFEFTVFIVIILCVWAHCSLSSMEVKKIYMD